MAKIIIELNTHEDPNDIRILRAVADAYGRSGNFDAAVEADRAADEAEAELPTETTEAVNDRPTTSAGKRTRKPKDAAPASGAEQPSTAVQSSDAPSTSADGSEQPEISVTAVNLKLRQLLDAKVPALKLQEIVKEATDGKYMSANHASNANDVAGLKAIMAGLEFFEASLK